MKYIVVTINENLEFDCVDDLKNYCTSNGIVQTGIHKSESTVEKLQGEPVFNKVFAGPMLDGSNIRYETWEANDYLSS